MGDSDGMELLQWFCDMLQYLENLRLFEMSGVELVKKGLLAQFKKYSSYFSLGPVGMDIVGHHLDGPL